LGLALPLPALLGLALPLPALLSRLALPLPPQPITKGLGASSAKLSQTDLVWRYS
jgi:hypothetical protein